MRHSEGAFHAVIRAEDIGVRATGSASATGSGDEAVARLQGVVTGIVSGETLATLTVSVPPTLVACTLANHLDRLGLRVGDPVAIDIPGEAVHLC